MIIHPIKGAFLPPTSFESVSMIHHAFNTQGQMSEPRQTDLTTCDFSKRIVDVESEEGNEDHSRA